MDSGEQFGAVFLVLVLPRHCKFFLSLHQNLSDSNRFRFAEDLDRVLFAGDLSQCRYEGYCLKGGVPIMPYSNPYFGEKTAIACDWEEEWGPDTDFTITSATLTIKPLIGNTAIRTAVAATVEAHRVSYLETFNAANGYTEGKTYKATFTVNIYISGGTYIEIHEDTFRVLPVA